MKKMHIIVIGGGVAGTSAAYVLSKKGYEVTILEKNDRLGGRVHSITTKDAIFETGAGFMTNIYKNTLNFIESTGLDKYLRTRKSYSAIVKNGVIHPLLSNSVIFGNNVISSRAKFRLAQELLRMVPLWNKLETANIWKAYFLDKQSLSQVFRNRYEQELLDYLIQPALDGYFYWSADNISMAMLAILVKATLTRRKTLILKCGLQRIPETAAKLSQVFLSNEATNVQRLSETEYEVTINSNHGKKKLLANGIVCATTATVVPKIIKGLNKKQLDFFRAFHYSSTAVVSKIYKPTFVPQNYGIVYPRKENTTLSGITIVSDSAKDDKKKMTLVKLYASGMIGKKLCKESDDKIDITLSKAVSSCNRIFDISEGHTLQYVQRWEEAIPEFNLGHFNRLRAFMSGEIESEKDSIVYAGDYIGGPFIEGAFTSGLTAASRLERKLNLE